MYVELQAASQLHDVVLPLIKLRLISKQEINFPSFYSMGAINTNPPLDNPKRSPL